MNLRRGLLRATLVVSIAGGLVNIFMSGRPSLDDFRVRRATEVEKTQAAEWAKARENSPEVADDLKNDRPAAAHHFKMFLIAHEGVVAKEHQELVPLGYVLQFYLLPFTLGFLAMWILYAVIRFVIVGYVIHGFRSSS